MPRRATCVAGAKDSCQGESEHCHVRKRISDVRLRTRPGDRQWLIRQLPAGPELWERAPPASLSTSCDIAAKRKSQGSRASALPQPPESPRRTCRGLGMIGLGRMGASMVRRLLQGGRACVVHDLQPSAIARPVKSVAIGAGSLKEMVSLLAHCGESRGFCVATLAGRLRPYRRHLTTHSAPG